MTTISFSVEDDIKRRVARWAKHAGKSQSDVFRDMVATYSFNEQLEAFSDKTEKVLAELGITSEQELEGYLESDETYQTRLRQQRLSGSH